MDLKQIAGEYAATFVKDGMKIGLGTGSTAYWTIQKLGQRVKEGLSIQAVPTSKETEALAQQLNIPLISLNDVQSLDLQLMELMKLILIYSLLKEAVVHYFARKL